MAMIEFDGVEYRDDRMFILYMCKCTSTVDGEIVTTTMYHDEVPDDAKWSLATFRNNERYTWIRADEFETRDELLAYMKEVEPQTPLVSLGGNSPHTPLPYEDFLKWKQGNNLEEYDYKKMFMSGGANNPQERLTTRRRR